MMTIVTTAQSKAKNKMAEEKSLKELLDGLIVSQKQDIHSFSRGHLNEANLQKPLKKASHQSWKSAKKPNINLVPKSCLPPMKQDTRHQDDMKRTILHFSVGTSGNAYMPAKAKPTPVSKAPTLLSAKIRASPPSRKSHHSDGILIEELALPDVLLAKTNYYSPKGNPMKSSCDYTEERHGSPNQDQDLKSTKEPLLPMLKHEFMPGYIEAVTKRDQLQKMRVFEHVVIRKQDAFQKNVMSGVKAVAHLEVKLQKDLSQLQHHGNGVNFHRLQVFSNTFADLMEDSSTFGLILCMIKNEYDNYITSLLDGQIAKHQILSSQVDQLASRDNNSDTLKYEMNNVLLMEEDGRQLLKENERLRKELEQETYIKNKPAAEDPSGGEFLHSREEQRQDLHDQIEELKAIILEKLDNMNDLKIKLRKEFVPSTVCSHLEQCIKETEVETQKLTSQKEFFERSILDMEHDLQQAIETADTTEKDARRVWKRVTAVKAVDRSTLHAPPGVGVTTTGPGGGTPPNPYHDSDDDPDDEQKWNWYIS